MANITVNANQVVIFYSIFTGTLLSKLVLGNEPSIIFTTSPGQAAIIIDRNKPYDDNTCYQLISTATGFVVNGEIDRCVVIDNTNTVTSVQKRDPAILPLKPGREFQILKHPYAHFGDVRASAVSRTFRRRYVQVHSKTGLVVATAIGTVDDTGVQPPVSPVAVYVMVPSVIYQIGDTVDLESVPGVIVAQNSPG